MGSANVQLLRKLEELFNSREFAAYLEVLDPAVEWHVSPEDPDTTVHHGREAVRGYLEGWVDAFADLQIHTEIVSEAGDRILTLIRFTGRGTGSGVTLDERVSFLWTLRGGRVTEVEDLGRVQASTK
jgi:ketosteroid isomerase-like protein